MFLAFFKHIFKITFRNLYRNKLLTTVNTFGLAKGLMISFIILTWVNFELSYDKFNKDYDQIYRITESDKAERSAMCSPTVKIPF